MREKTKDDGAIEQSPEEEVLRMIETGVRLDQEPPSLSSSSTPMNPPPPPIRTLERPGAVAVAGPGARDQTPWVSTPSDEENNAETEDTPRDAVASTTRRDPNPADPPTLCAELVNPVYAEIVEQVSMTQRRRQFLLVCVIPLIISVVVIVTAVLLSTRKKNPSADDDPATTVPSVSSTTAQPSTSTPLTSSTPTTAQTPTVPPTPEPSFVWRQIGRTINGDKVEGYHYFGHSIDITADGSMVAIGASPDNEDQSYTEVYRLAENQGNSVNSSSFYAWETHYWTPVGNRILGPIGDPKVTADAVFLSDEGQDLVIFSDSFMGIGLAQIFKLAEDESTWEWQSSFSGTNLSESIESIRAVSVSSDFFRMVLKVQRVNTTEYFVQTYRMDGRPVGGSFNSSFSVYRRSLSRGGNTLVLGADGYVGVWEFGRSSWFGPVILRGKDDFNSESRYGDIVAVSDDGESIAVGDRYGYGKAGSVTIFEKIHAGNWQQRGRTSVGDLNAAQTIADSETLELSGDGSTVIVSGTIGNLNPGSRLKVYRYIQGDWEELDNIDDFNTDDFYCSVSAAGKRVACGSPYDLSFGDDIGYVRVHNLEPDFDAWKDPQRDFVVATECFQSTKELRAASDSYVGGKNRASNSPLAVMHGWPMDRWCVELIEDFSSLFSEARNRMMVNFNESIGSWNVSRATSMHGMFRFAWKFNQDISNWDTSSVKTMNGMFGWCKEFRQDLSNWKMSSVVERC